MKTQVKTKFNLPKFEFQHEFERSRKLIYYQEGENKYNYKYTNTTTNTYTNTISRKRMYYEEGEDNLFQTGQADGLFIDTLSSKINSC